ncbi:MAG TPA: hypothetical protein VL282_11950 [Tepidisphaeraceae bacterium]|nr:hypothetical protein [Tepidisphaeraceae bacterium]
MKSLGIAVSLLVAVSVFAQPKPAATPKPATSQAAAKWDPDVFPISYWCGPPADFVTLDRFKEIADAGFTYAMPPCGAATPEINKKILDYCKQVGIKAFIQDGRMPIGFGPKGEGKERIDAIVKDYANHPALAGYFITDEPGGGAFPALAQTVEYLKEKDPKHVSYINLFPNYAPEWALGGTYPFHVEQFIKLVKPAIVSYDHYHFHRKYDAPGFFNNLQVVREKSQEAKLPFWNIVLAVNHFDYRELTEAEKRWEAMQTLAYGGKGVMFFTYWQPDDKGMWGTAIINANGTKTRQYDEVKRVNKDVQAIGKYLLKANSVSVFEYGQPGDFTNTGGSNPVSFTGPNITVGNFSHGETRYVLFANRDYKEAVTKDVSIDTAGQKLEHLDKASGQWIAEDGNGVVLKIAAGDGELYRWKVAPTTKPATTPAPAGEPAAAKDAPKKAPRAKAAKKK